MIMEYYGDDVISKNSKLVSLVVVVVVTLSESFLTQNQLSNNGKMESLKHSQVYAHNINLPSKA